MGHTNSSAALTYRNNSDAEFRSWVQFISNALQTGGVIKTADTGQINTATVLAPTVLTTSQGYEIRRFSDALQSTKPVFIKIEYGANSNTVTNPVFWLTVGTGSDGAGNITGTLLARAMYSAGNNSQIGAGGAIAKISVDANRCNWGILYTSSASTSGFSMFGLERTKDNAGADNGDGLFLVYVGGSTGAGTQFRTIAFSGSQPTAEAEGGAVHPGTDSTLAGVNVGIFPLQFSWFGNKVYPPRNFVCYRTSEVLVDTVNPVDFDGVTITYVACGQRHQASVRSANAPGCMMRYD